MAFDLAAAKALTRRTTHKTMGITADYLDRHLAAPVALRVRYHGKQSLVGDLQNEGYSMTIDGIDRVIFNKEELAEKGVQVQRGGRVTITAAGYDGIVLIIDTQDKSEGPVNEIWRASKV